MLRAIAWWNGLGRQKRTGWLIIAVSMVYIIYFIKGRLLSPGGPILTKEWVWFALSFAGIVFVLLSQAAATKRIVLPVTLIVFHVMAFLVLQRSGAITGFPLPIVLLALTANAAMVWWRMGYCTECGRTIADRAAGSRCPACARHLAEADK